MFGRRSLCGTVDPWHLDAVSVQRAHRSSGTGRVIFTSSRRSLHEPSRHLSLRDQRFWLYGLGGDPSSSGRGSGTATLPRHGRSLHGIIEAMQRFQQGEQVLVSMFMGDAVEPPRCGVIREVLGTSSLLYDYLIEVGHKRYHVQDAWLVPGSITIHEAPEWSDLGT